MDWQNFRRSTAIDEGPGPDQQGLGPMQQFMQNMDNVQHAMGWGQYNPNQAWEPGSMQDQMGANSIMGSGGDPNTPDDTGYDETGGMFGRAGTYTTQSENPTPGILNNETDESGAYDSNGQWQGLDYGNGGGDSGGDSGGDWGGDGGGDYGYARGGKVKRSKRYEEGGATPTGQSPPSTDTGEPVQSFASGGVMDGGAITPPPGYGSGGTFTQADMDYYNSTLANAQNQPSVAPGATAGLVAGGNGYSGGFAPTTPTAWGTAGGTTPGGDGSTGKSYGFTNWGGGNRFGGGFANFGWGGGAGQSNNALGFEDGGSLDATSDRDQTTPNLAAAMKTVDEIFKYGYQKHGLGALAGDDSGGGQAGQGGDDVQSFDEGDEVQAIPTGDDDNSPAPQQQANDPNGGWQGGIPTMDNVRGAMRSMPSPAQPLVQPAQRILGMIQGQGAMPIERSQAEEAGAPSDDQNEKKLMTAHKIAQQQGPDAAWGYVQSLRKQFDLHRTNAAVKAQKGDLPNSTHAANKAMTNVLDGMDTQFTPTPDGRGVRVRIKRVGQ